MPCHVALCVDPFGVFCIEHVGGLAFLSQVLRGGCGLKDVGGKDVAGSFEGCGGWKKNHTSSRMCTVLVWPNMVAAGCGLFLYRCLAGCACVRPSYFSEKSD